MIRKNVVINGDEYLEEISKNGSVFYWKDLALHNDHGPAILARGGSSKPDGWDSYYQNGLKHRANGPAVVHNNGNTEYWEFGQQI